MDQIRSLIIKFIYIAAVTLIFLTYLLVPSVPILASLVVSAVIALVFYYLGDRFILTHYGALIASIANFVLAAVIFSLARSFIRQPIPAGAIFSSAAVIGVAEWFYYRYARQAPVMEGEIGGEQIPGPGEHQGSEGGPEGQEQEQEQGQPGEQS